MGAWGYGILQSDTAQDGISALNHMVQEEIRKLPEEPSEASAARLGAMVGLLLQSSHYSFDPENTFSADLAKILHRHEPFFSALPGNAALILRAVLEGKGQELANRPAKLDPRLEEALHHEVGFEFAVQRDFGQREPDLFAHPEAAAYVQEYADQCADWIDEEFDDEEIVGDFSREGEGCMGGLAMLLLVEPCRVEPVRILAWREKARDAAEESEAELTGTEYEEEELGFQRPFMKNLERAFELALEKFGRGN